MSPKRASNDSGKGPAGELRRGTSFTPADRLLVLSTWTRSKLAGPEFSRIVNVSPHLLYAWRQRFEERGPAGLEEPASLAGHVSTARQKTLRLMRLRFGEPDGRSAMGDEMKEGLKVRRVFVEAQDPPSFFSDLANVIKQDEQVILQFYESIPGAPDTSGGVTEVRTRLRASIFVGPKHAKKIGRLLLKQIDTAPGDPQQP